MVTQTLIVGGGMSGLALAAMLARKNSDFLLLEARTRLGGRILTQKVQGGYYDLGPAWFWPGQPRIAALIAELGLSRFEQFHQGALTFEDAQGAVQRGRGHASMQGSYRLEGGLAALTDALAARLPETAVQLNAEVAALEQTPEGIRAITTTGQRFEAERAVLCVPPRVAATLRFLPALSEDTRAELNAIPTWMAGQAKVVALYETPFWRTAGLSGDAISHRGPLVEVHDASPAVGGPYALFGFIGVPPAARMDEAALRRDVSAQLARLFGPLAAKPSALFLKDWAQDARTATPLDQQPLLMHPQYGTPPALRGLWDNRLTLGSTEMAPEFGGYLEGALEAAENVAAGILSSDGR